MNFEFQDYVPAYRPFLCRWNDESYMDRTLLEAAIWRLMGPEPDLDRIRAVLCCAEARWGAMSVLIPDSAVALIILADDGVV